MLNNIYLRFVILFIGFVLVGFGVALMVSANIGLSPYEVLHHGLSKTFNIGIGVASIWASVVIIILATFFKIYPGLGTILNAAIIGIMVDSIIPLFEPIENNLTLSIIYVVIGAIVLALGSALYLASRFGAGPRDSFIVGIMQKYQVDTKFVRPVVEAVSLIIGVILGGQIGIGTIIILLITGYFIDIFFKLIKFDAKKEHQMNLMEQIICVREYFKNGNSSL